MIAEHRRPVRRPPHRQWATVRIGAQGSVRAVVCRLAQETHPCGNVACHRIVRRGELHYTVSGFNTGHICVECVEPLPPDETVRL